VRSRRKRRFVFAWTALEVTALGRRFVRIRRELLLAVGSVVFTLLASVLADCVLPFLARR
jgi:hypothetical protein